MFEELNERRKSVERNIAKGFGVDDADLDFEKALEDELEKGRAKKTFAVGDTFTRHGITYKCTGISANTGRPTWSKVKDSDGIKPEVGKYVDLDSRSSWDDIWDAAKEVAQKLWDEDGSKISGDKTREEFVKEKMNSICAGFSASVPKKTVIANINTIHQHLAKLKEQNTKKKKQDEENKALSKELDSVSGFKRMTLHGPGYDYFEISKLSSGVYSLRGYKLQSSSPLLRTYSKKEILDKIKELNLKSSGVKTDPSLTNGL